MLDKKRAASDARVKRWIVMALTGWAVGVFAAGYFDVFRQMPLPSIAVLVVAGIAAPVATYYTSRSFRGFIASISYKHLTLFNIWRIPAGAAFLYYGSQGWLPEHFVINAGYGDLAVGFLVPVVLMLPESRAKYFGFHIFGMLDFILAVGTGLTFTLWQVPLMENIAGNPIVLIPLFGVPVTGALHIMTLTRLFHERNAANLPASNAIDGCASPRQNQAAQ